MKFFRVISNLLRFDRTNWTALTLCLLAAAVFWIFNALNKNYSANLSFPLQVEYDQTRFATADRIPPSLTVNVAGVGWDLLRKSLGQKVPVITIPLERPTEVRRIPSATLSPQVMSQLGSLQLNYVVLDTLHLRIEPRVTRRLKLSADMSRVSFRNNFGRVSPVVVLPDSILLEGPATYVNALPDSIVIQVPSRRVMALYRENLEVVFENSEFIKRNPPVAEVMFEVAQVIQLSHRLPIAMPRLVGLQANKDSLQIKIQVPQRDLQRFNEDVETLSLSLPPFTISKGDTLRLLPVLRGVPSYASVIQVDSVELWRKLPE